MVNFADAAATRRKTFCGLVMKVVEELKIQRVALFGAFLAEVLYTDPVPLTGFASDPAILERLKVSSTAYQGPTGIVGALADRLRVRRRGDVVGNRRPQAEDRSPASARLMPPIRRRTISRCVRRRAN
jgi:PAC2 family